jgi:hypothetical protein
MYLTHLETRIWRGTFHIYFKKWFFWPSKLCCSMLLLNFLLGAGSQSPVHMEKEFRFDESLIMKAQHVGPLTTPNHAFLLGIGASIKTSSLSLLSHGSTPHNILEPTTGSPSSTVAPRVTPQSYFLL